MEQCLERPKLGVNPATHYNRMSCLTSLPLRIRRKFFCPFPQRGGEAFGIFQQNIALISPAVSKKSPHCKIQMPLEASSAEMLRRDSSIRATSLRYKVLLHPGHLGKAASGADSSRDMACAECGSYPNLTQALCRTCTTHQHPCQATFLQGDAYLLTVPDLQSAKKPELLHNTVAVDRCSRIANLFP